MAVKVNLEKCTGCGTCEEVCPVEAIKVENEKAKVDEEECVDCCNQGYNSEPIITN